MSVQIKIGDKTLVIEDGCNINVEIAGEEIRVKPSAPQYQWIRFLPMYPTPAYPVQPIISPTITWSGSSSSGNYN